MLSAKLLHRRYASKHHRLMLSTLRIIPIAMSGIVYWCLTCCCLSLRTGMGLIQQVSLLENNFVCRFQKSTIISQIYNYLIERLCYVFTRLQPRVTSPIKLVQRVILYKGLYSHSLRWHLTHLGEQNVTLTS